MLSQTEENYLKAIGKLAGEAGAVGTAELSKALNVSAPTVNSMMKRLDEKGLVSYKKYRPATMTEKGRKAAAGIIRRHRLTEMFLQEKMGFDWEQVHEVAEQIEHVSSPAFFDRMDEILGFPRFDPHGSPIPDRHGEIKKRHLKKLCDAVSGQQVELVALDNTTNDFLAFLNKRGLTIGALLTVKSVEPYDGSMEVMKNDGEVITLGMQVCRDLLVEII